MLYDILIFFLLFRLFYPVPLSVPQFFLLQQSQLGYALSQLSV